MALTSFKGTLRASGAVQASGVVVAVDAAQDAVEAVDSDIGVLDADAATPTEAHVDDLVGTWATLEPLILAAQTQVSGGVVVTVDLASVTTVSQLRKIFNEILVTALGSGLMTA